MWELPQRLWLLPILIPNFLGYQKTVSDKNWRDGLGSPYGERADKVLKSPE